MTFKLIKNNFPFLLLVLIFSSCQSAKQNENNTEQTDQTAPNLEECCVSAVPDRFNGSIKTANFVLPVNIDSLKKANLVLEEMLFIPAGVFNMGARDAQFAREDEYPVHTVKVNSFFMDPHPVTNA
ncbi:MAG: SUMF1/EgtB/PvdO family nonheme iron enzyme, partial [Mariniphaga sp.]|nr:SUMF1/EgtB/PvdO family nonheme iron enzyme [Mariniphaga sp.]